MHLEDDVDFSQLLAWALQRAGLDVDLVTVDRPDAFRAALDRGGVDLVVSDRSVRGYGGLAALRDLVQRALDLPFVMLSGSTPPEGMAPYLAAGVADYLLKDDLPRVAEALRRLLFAGRDAARPGEPLPPGDAAVALAAAVSQLSRAAGLADIVAVVPRAARLISGADGATLALRDAGECRQVGEVGLAPRPAARPLPTGDSVSGRAMGDGRTVLVEDADAGEQAGRALGEGKGARSALAIPVGRGTAVAAIAVYWTRPHAPAAREVELLTALADVTATALERAGLQPEQDRAPAVAIEHAPAASEWESLSRLMAHDLRNPLWQIRGFAQVVREEHAAALGEGGRDALDHLLAASSDLGRVINGVVDLANVSAAPFAPRLLDLGAVARDVAAMLSAATPDRDVEWRLCESLFAIADPELLRTLLEKLLSNAFRFTSGRDGALIELGAGAGGRDPAFATFFVRDNGAGFDPRDRARLFSPFQRLGPADGDQRSGTGLAIVQRIVHRHGGEAWAEGAPGAGATFSFTLPASH